MLHALQQLVRTTLEQLLVLDQHLTALLITFTLRLPPHLGLHHALLLLLCLALLRALQPPHVLAALPLLELRVCGQYSLHLCGVLSLLLAGQLLLSALLLLELQALQLALLLLGGELGAYGLKLVLVARLSGRDLASQVLLRLL